MVATINLQTIALIALIAFCILVLCAVAFFAVFRGGGKLELFKRLGKLKAKGENPPPRGSAASGVRISGAKAGKDIGAHHVSAGGVDIEEAIAADSIGGAQTTVNPPPKMVAPGPAETAGPGILSHVEKAGAGRDVFAAKEEHSYEAASVSVGLSLHQFPPPPPVFTGRDADVAEIEKQLTAGHAAVSGMQACAGLQGVGGVGKTALALVLADRLKDRYPDAQLFVNLHSADTKIPALSPAQAMESIIRCWRPQAQLPEGEEALGPIYSSVLAEAGRILLVLDDAADASQVQPLMPPGNCLLLVTSRAQFSLPGLAPRHIDCLAPEESQALLLTVAPRLDGHAAEGAELCGHLPLALKVFAEAVNDKSLTPVPELLTRLRAGEEHLAPVEAALEVSAGLLDAELRRRWTLLAVFPASFDLRAAAAVWGADVRSRAVPDVSPEASAGSDVAERESMRALVNASLVDWNESPGRFRLHEIVRRFCAGRFPEAEREAVWLRYAEHYCNVGEETNNLYQQGGGNALRGLELFDRERAHIEAAFEWLRPRSDRESAALLVSLVGAVTFVGDLRFHPRQIIRWMEGQRDAARLIGDRGWEGSALGNLGLAHAALGEAREAIAFYEQTLEIVREIGDRGGEGEVLGSLGSAHAALGETREAIAFYEQALDIAREIGDRSGEGEVLGNLGSAHAALGEAREAIASYEQALNIVREIGDRGGEGEVLGSLGSAHDALGESREACAFYEQALDIAREIGDRRREGNVLGNLGNAYGALGETREAIAFYERALEIERENGDRRREGEVLGYLGSAHAALGEAREAIEFYEQALEIERENGDRRREGEVLGNLGSAHSALGEAREAIGFYEQALEIEREIGDRHREGEVLGSLGSAHAAQGEARKAIEFYEQALEIGREIGDRRGEGNVLGNLGNAYSDLEEARKAIEFYEQALEIAREIGDRSGEGEVLGNLGNAYSDLEEARKAIEFYEQALEIAREIGDRRGEGNVLGNLGSAYFDLEEARKAIEFYEQALEIEREIGDRGAEGEVLGNLGNAYSDLEEVRKAIEFYEQALEIEREIGDRDGEGNTLWNSALAFDQSGDRVEAIVRAEAALRIFEAIEDPNVANVRATLAHWCEGQ